MLVYQIRNDQTAKLFTVHDRQVHPVPSFLADSNATVSSSVTFGYSKAVAITYCIRLTRI